LGGGRPQFGQTIARSPLALGYVGLAQFLPIAVLFFVAGDIADRYNRRRILAISYVVQALATASVLVLTLLSPGRLSPANCRANLAAQISAGRPLAAQ